MSTVITPEILLPKVDSLEKWAVVACDQFTSEPEYWNRLESFVGAAPSALRLTFPEIYLKDGIEKRSADINRTMREYLEKGYFEARRGFVLVEREVEEGKNRIGLIVAVDLEKYDWNRVKTDIRATENTIPERLPVRVKIRENALMELPHILLLVDDKEKNIIEPLYEKRGGLEKLYDFDLNMEGGHIRGWLVEETAETIKKFDALLDPERQIAYYGEDAGIMLAVGDGNHSLASCKAHWENVKKTLSAEEAECHPSRYALAEVVNLYDEAMIFEPIHRVAIGANEKVLNALKTRLSGDGTLKLLVDGEEFVVGAPSEPGRQIAEIEKILTDLKLEGVEIDYIHGDEHLKEVVKSTGGVGIYCPLFPKERLVPYVVSVGNLPKKAFSIGAAEFKKYYLEARKIVK